MDIRRDAEPRTEHLSSLFESEHGYDFELTGIFEAVKQHIR
jgi:hypothetical protein